MLHRSVCRQLLRRRRDYGMQLNSRRKIPALPQPKVPTTRTTSRRGGGFIGVFRSSPRSVSVSCPWPPSFCHPLRAHANAACRPHLRGTDRGGGPRGRGRRPRPSCRGASRGCPRGYHTKGRDDSRGHYPESRGDSRGRRPQGIGQRVVGITPKAGSSCESNAESVIYAFQSLRCVPSAQVA